MLELIFQDTPFNWNNVAKGFREYVSKQMSAVEGSAKKNKRIRSGGVPQVANWQWKPPQDWSVDAECKTVIARYLAISEEEVDRRYQEAAGLDIPSIGQAAAQNMSLKEPKEETKKARLEDPAEPLPSSPVVAAVAQGAFGWLLRDAGGYTFVSPRQAVFACDEHTIEISTLDVLPEEFAQHEVVLHGPSSKIVVSVEETLAPPRKVKAPVAPDDMFVYRADFAPDRVMHSCS